MALRPFSVCGAETSGIVVPQLRHRGVGEQADNTAARAIPLRQGRPSVARNAQRACAPLAKHRAAELAARRRAPALRE